MSTKAAARVAHPLSDSDTCPDATRRISRPSCYARRSSWARVSSTALIPTLIRPRRFHNRRLSLPTLISNNLRHRSIIIFKISTNLNIFLPSLFFFSCQNWQGFIYLYLYIGLLVNKLRGLDYFFSLNLSFFLFLKFYISFLNFCCVKNWATLIFYSLYNVIECLHKEFEIYLGNALSS